MSTDEFLTRDERDALMEVVSKKARESGAQAGASKEEATLYDLSLIHIWFIAGTPSRSCSPAWVTMA